ncbi:MAG: cytochrome d ubiquinol oxidase subunit II [Ktedonobacteraceae bacterium]|nr:cytochrome d ubiquinol oxidase subunit II [Ktedonobacteraceae bacterium]
MILPYAVAVLLWISIIIYASLEGADFGGGLWDSLAFGSQKGEMRKLIKDAIAPVWEANNVWLTYLIVGLLTAFPVAAQLLTTALFIPLVLVLIGIVLRGATFIFRSFSPNALQKVWGRIFSVSSIITPFLFGTMAAAVASGALRIVHGRMPVGLIGAWLTPFAITVGLMSIALCATVSAIYLAVEAEAIQKQKLADSFRWRALLSMYCTGVLALVSLVLSPSEAPILWQGILNHAIWAVVVTILIGIGVGICLVLRRFRLSRILVIIETGALIGTWGLAQLPYIVPPSLTVTGAASPPLTLLELFICALVGMSMLIPALWFLFHVFKGLNVVPPVREKEVRDV